MPSFACPKCKKVLKTAAPLPEGKKIKCPACATVFVMPAIKEQTAVQARKPTAAPGPAPMASAAERAKPRQPGADDEAARKASRKAKARTEEERDDDEEDDRPKKRNKKKREQEGNKNLILILGSAGAFVLILAVVLFVWPGLLLSGGNAKVASKEIPVTVPSKTARPLDPLALVPNDAEIVVGLSFVQARKNADDPRKVDQILQMLAVSPPMLELINNADRGVFATAGFGPGAKAVAVLTTLTPVEAGKVAEAFNAKPPAGKGKGFYRLPGSGLLALPDSKTIVLSSLSQAELEKLLEGKGKLAADLQPHVDSVSDKAVWGVVKLAKLLQDSLKDKEQEIVEMADKTGGTDAVPAIKNAKFARFYVDGAKDTEIKVEVECASDEHAGKLEPYAKALWEGQGKPLLSAAPLLLGKAPGMEGVKLLIGDVSKSFRIARQGPLVSASLTVSESTQKELGKMDPAAMAAVASAAAAPQPSPTNPPPAPPMGKGRLQAKAPAAPPQPSAPIPDGVVPKQGATVPLGDSLVAAPLPEGYQALTQELKAPAALVKSGKGVKAANVGKSAGKIIMVGKPNQISKVVVRIDTRDLAALPARRAAATAYVSELGSSLTQEGYRLTNKTFPNFDMETFENPIAVKFAFVHANGAKRWTHSEIFFTNVGYGVHVIADDEQTLESLTAWAKTVRPKS